MTDENNNTVEVLDYDITDIRFNKEYIFYYTFLTRLIFTGVLPFVYLAVVNTFIILAIKKNIPSYSSFKQSRRSSSQLASEIRRNTVFNKYINSSWFDFPDLSFPPPFAELHWAKNYRRWCSKFSGRRNLVSVFSESECFFFDF